MMIALVWMVMIAAASPPIAIRHDVSDARYLELGAAYASVVRVGANGGDGTLIAPDWVLTAAHVAAGMARRGGGSFQVTGRAIVAVDTIGAGEGPLVLITQGSSARLAEGFNKSPIDAVVVGIVDEAVVMGGRVE